MGQAHKHLRQKRWQTVRRAVLDRDGWRCVRCGSARALEVDHKLPMARGGAAYDLGNLQTLCRDCHIAKTRAEWVEQLPADKRAWVELLDRLTG